VDDEKTLGTRCKRALGGRVSGGDGGDVAGAWDLLAREEYHLALLIRSSRMGTGWIS